MLPLLERRDAAGPLILAGSELVLLAAPPVSATSRRPTGDPATPPQALALASLPAGWWLVMIDGAVAFIGNEEGSVLGWAATEEWTGLLALEMARPRAAGLARPTETFPRDEMSRLCSGGNPEPETAGGQDHRMDDPTPGPYRHFKGGEYEVLVVARHSESNEQIVVYCSLDDPALVWARPRGMFIEQVVHEGRVVPRFSRLG